MGTIKKTILKRSLLLFNTLILSSCSFQQPATIKTVESTSIDSKLNKYIEIGKLTKNDNVSVINVSERGANFLAKISFGDEGFTTKASSNGSLQKQPSDIAKVDVYLLELAASPAAGTDPMAATNIIGSKLNLAKTSASFNILFSNVPANTSSSKKYYVGVVAKDTAGNVISKLPSVAWTGNTATVAPAVAITTSGVYVDSSLQVDTTTNLTLSVPLLDAVGAQISTAVTSVNGTIVGGIASSVSFSPQLLVVAGNLSGVTPTTANQNSTAVKLLNPYGVVTDSSGNVYISDTTNNFIEKLDTNGNIKVIGGNATGTAPSTLEQNATDVKFLYPYEIALDSTGNIYINDAGNNFIEKLDTNGKLKVIAGNATGTAPSTLEQNATDVKFTTPTHGLSVDSAGNIYIADTNNHFIEKLDTNGKLKVIAGNASGTSPSLLEQNATDVKLNFPSGIKVDSVGNIYIADSNNKVIEKIDTNGKLKVIAGNSSGVAPTTINQLATNVSLGTTRGIDIDSAGNIYFAVGDNTNHYISKIDTAGNLKIVAGKSGGYAPSIFSQAATNVQLSFPYGIDIDSAGNLYIADPGSNYIEKVTGL